MGEEIFENVKEIEEQEELNEEESEKDDALENPEETKEKTEGQDSEIYGSPESFDYSEIKLPENMVLDEEMVDKFNPIAKELNLSNKSANKLMKLAVELTSKQTAKFEDLATQLVEAEQNSYMQLLNTDKELNGYSEEEYSQYLTTANLGVKSVVTQGFKDLIKHKGLTNHPEFIKTFHAIGKLCKGDTPPEVKTPAGPSQNAADILYGSKD
ncbi:MAG: hypothetical protein J6V44_09035 [Methanobrevibacter sp.]|nr:hypothetical protein [Methanobrevibacter sp.]